MKTKEMLEQLDSKYLSGGLITEIKQKLRQLEDIKDLLREMWELSTQRDDIQYDLAMIFWEDK